MDKSSHDELQLELNAFLDDFLLTHPELDDVINKHQTAIVSFDTESYVMIKFSHA